MTFLFMNLFNEGGPLFMYTTLASLIICITLIIITFLKGDEDQKKTDIIKHVSLFALVWGFLGFFIGLIGAFDSMSSINGGIATSMLAGGLKVALLSPSFGMLAFLIARIGLILLRTFKK